MDLGEANNLVKQEIEKKGLKAAEPEYDGNFVIYRLQIERVVDNQPTLVSIGSVTMTKKTLEDHAEALLGLIADKVAEAIQAAAKEPALRA